MASSVSRSVSWLAVTSLTASSLAMVAVLNGCAPSAPSEPAYRPPSRTVTGAAPQYNAAARPSVTTYAPPPVPYGAPPVAPAPAPAPVPQGKLKAAILLPLSGPNAALGQAMLNAAQQAVFDAAGNNFELQPHDTAALGGAAGAARDALAAGATLFIGPLFAADVGPVAQIAQGARTPSGGGVPVLALSTDTTLAEPGVFVMGLAPGPQVDRVVHFASAHGVHRYAALVPSTPYGHLVGQALQDAVARDGGVVVDLQTFEPGTPQAASQAARLAAERDAVDAFFLPEADTNLKILADQLAANGITPDATAAGHPRLIGTGLWDVADLGQKTSLLAGGWYAAPDPAGRRSFMAAYKAAYNQEPPRLTTIAYDATALAAVLAKRGDGFSTLALLNPNGFAGLDGIFRLLPDGKVDRALAVDEVTTGGPRLIDPARTAFSGTR